MPEMSQICRITWHTRGRLQWGRDVSIPEMSSSPRTHRSAHRFNGAGMFPSQKCAYQGAAQTVTEDASMGPGCFHPRNQATARRGDPRNAASMGPGCFHPRNKLTPGAALQAMRLQWGRDVSIPEMQHSRGKWLSATGFNGAGMFPSQKFSYGIPPYRGSIGFNGAGMFPSQKCPPQHADLDGGAASMGPGCFHPRNSARSTRADVRWFQLQWGRDVSIPEIRFRHPPAPLKGALQWGRDVSIPEMTTCTFDKAGCAALQWGRDVSIPEMFGRGFVLKQ